MKLLTRTIIAALIGITSTAHAASPWFQTATTVETGTVIKAYIIPHSVRPLGNPALGRRIFNLFVRITFDPPYDGTQATLSDVAIDCDNHTWGEYVDSAFTADGEPKWLVAHTTTRPTAQNPLQLPTVMHSDAATALTFATANYVCGRQ